MEAILFQLHKVRQAIKAHGRVMTVKIPFLDAYDEPVEDAEVVTVMGLYHETTGYITKSTKDGSSMNRKSSPMFLCEKTSVTRIYPGLKAQIGNRQYIVVEIKDLDEAGVIADISLEEIQDGNHL